MRVSTIASIIFALAASANADIVSNHEVANADLSPASGISAGFDGRDVRVTALVDEYDRVIDHAFNELSTGNTDAGQLFDTLGDSYDNCYLSHSCTPESVVTVEYQFNFATQAMVTISWFRVQQAYDPVLGGTPPASVFPTAVGAGDQYPAGKLEFFHRIGGTQEDASGSSFEPMANVFLNGVGPLDVANGGTGYGFTGWEDAVGSTNVNWGEILKFEFDDAVCWDYQLRMMMHPFTAGLSAAKFISVCEWELGHDVGTFDDPIVKGFNGQSFYFMGSVNDVYNLVSSEHFQLNTRIISHPGMFKLNSWMGEIGVKAYGHTVSFTNDSVALCDGTPCLDGKYQSLSDLFEVKFSSANGSLDITLDQHIKIGLRVHGGDWTGNNTHLDFSFMGDASSLGTMHGILGQTASKARNESVLADSTQGEGIIDGTFLDYLVKDGLFGEKFTFNKYSYDGSEADFIGGAARRLLAKNVLHGSVGVSK